MTSNSIRGALLVLEGCDRCGKTTQCKMLVESLNSHGIKAQMWRFPDRQTKIGKLINDYLEKKCEVEDHAIHLLFSANRWEAVPKMKQLLNSGTTLVVDRYAYSGVAFSSSKPGLSRDWCKQPDIGLPKPDAVFYLNLSADAAAKRGSFGGERYEQTAFQKKVAENFKLLKDDSWKVIDADKTVEDLHTVIKAASLNTIKKCTMENIDFLWADTSKEG